MDPLNRDRGDTAEWKSEQHSSSGESSACGPGGPPLRPDPCVFLLDAIDAQLGKLQVKRWKQREDDRLDSDGTSRPVAPVTWEAATGELKSWMGSKVEMESHMEQAVWRLERLLGDTCQQGTMPGDPQPPSESICTEDFVRCFREEMVELPLPEGSVQELDREEEAERASMLDGDWTNHKSQNAVKCDAITNTTSGQDEGSVVLFQHEPEQRQELQRSPSEISGDQNSHDGVDVWNFDAVSIDSDLDSVRVDQVRQHLRRRRRPPVQNKRTFLKDTDEDSNGRRSRRRKLRRPSAKTLATREEMSERLCALRRRCEKEEETLRLKKSHLTEVELSLSELQLRRKNAFHDLERLSAENGHLETEKRQLEVLLKERKAESRSLTCQLQQLKRQKESHICEVRSLHEELKKREQIKLLARVEETDTAPSQLGRQTVGRQLSCAKAELFSQQRRAREKQESMRQMLEETREELLRVSEAAAALRNRSSCLEETRQRETEALKCQACELQGKLGACSIRVDTLEKTLRQKEQQLRQIQEQHRVALKEAQEHAHAAMEAALEQQRKDLASVHDQQIEKVRKAVGEERAKWEAEKMDAVHFHCRLLEEQNSRSLETARTETEREKSNALVLRRQAAELQSRVRELEADRRARQRERDSLLSVVCESLKRERRAELDELRKQMLQEREETALQLEQSVRRAEGETEKIRRVLEEQQIGHDEARARREQQLGVWARQLVAECDFLHRLMRENGGQQNCLQLSPSPTVDEALLRLKAQREALKGLVGRLHQELESQRQASEKLRIDKERELRIQREQMRTERNQALDCLKGRSTLRSSVA
ncbi:trichohyalin isoform X2 [Syngnathoides biaculeatus]|uniref:trichohyalin isoform X2 n=1 Tax=Syngnathoides biaculeatus TaxID=300417 RepID=UPI002ADDFF64|nr:trichohyalin isoform X2 [Syngnathoides biaculeatus]